MPDYTYCSIEQGDGACLLVRTWSDKNEALNTQGMVEIHRNGRIALINPQERTISEWAWIINYLSERFVQRVRAI